MNPQDIKSTLEAIGYPVKGGDAYDILGDLHTQYGSTKVGSSLNHLGDAAPLYIRSGNVAHLVDDPQDLSRACLQIKALLKQREGAKPVVMPPEVRSRYLGDIREAIEGEIDIRERTKRPLGFDRSDFPVTSNELRQQSRSSNKILDGLLSQDKAKQAKALDAFRSLMIVQEAA